MNYPRSLNLLATLAVAATLALGGCKSNNQQTAQNAQPAQPAAQQPAPDQQAPAAASPAAQPAAAPAQRPAAQPRQATRPAAPVTQPVASAPAPAPAPAPVPVAPPPPPKPVEITLPAGTTISVHTDTDLGSKISKPDQGFTATVSDNIRYQGQIIIPRGARAQGVVVDAKAQGKMKGEALLSIRLTRVRTKWGSYGISTATIDSTEKGKGKRTAVVTGGGTALGAIIGGLAGGGKGAAIGALAGAGAGAAGSAFTGNKEIVVPAETLLTFTLSAPVDVTEKMEQGDQPELQQPPPSDQQ
jgi:hypothetical protein